MSSLDFTSDNLRWDNTGTEITTDDKDDGYSAGDMYPAEYANYRFNQIYQFVQAAKTAVDDNDSRATDIESSFSADWPTYYGNKKDVYSFQSVDDISVAGTGTISLDTTNYILGDASVELAASSASAAGMYGVDGELVDLTTLNNGEDSSDDDYITIAIKADDYTLISSAVLRFYISGGVNYKYYSITPTSNDWEFFNIKKSDFSETTTIDWADVTYWHVSFTSTAATSLNVQIIELQKKDPTSDYPNPAQRNGTRELEIKSGSYYFAKDGVITLDTSASIFDGLVKAIDFTSDFYYSVSSQLISGATYIQFLRLNANAYGYIALEDSGLRINNVYYGDTLTISEGDTGRLDLYYNATENSVTMTSFYNGEYHTSLTFLLDDLDTAITDIEQIGIGAIINRQQKYTNFVLSPIFAARHAATADMANELIAQPYARVQSSSNQSIDTATYTDVIFEQGEMSGGFDESEIDSSGFTEITIPKTGDYSISANVQFASNATGLRVIQIYGSGDVIAGDEKNAVSGGTTYMIAHTEIHLSKGDLVKLVAFQTSGSSLNINTVSNATNVLAIKYLGK